MGPNQGFGEQNVAMGGRIPSFPTPDAPTTPGPFGPGLARNEGTIPGIGAAMSLADSAGQGEQKPPILPSGAPPLPPGPHPSLLAGNQQPQPYQQNAPPIQQHQLPQQMSSMPLPPPNMPQMQPPHLSMLQHPHLPRPPPQLQQLNMPANVPSSMPNPSMRGSMPGPMGMQGGINPLPQGHYMGINPPGNMPQGGIPNGLPNMQGQSNPSSNQMFQPGGGFNRPQAGQMPMMPGINPYQSGNPNAPGMQSNYNIQSGVPPPLPPGPPPPAHGQSHSHQ